jgi:hypothetical protein
MFMSHHQNNGQNYNLKEADTYFENIIEFRYLEMTATNQNCIHKEIKIILSSGMLATVPCRIFCLPVPHLRM